MDAEHRVNIEVIYYRWDRAHSDYLWRVIIMPHGDTPGIIERVESGERYIALESELKEA